MEVECVNCPRINSNPPPPTTVSPPAGVPADFWLRAWYSPEEGAESGWAITIDAKGTSKIDDVHRSGMIVGTKAGPTLSAEQFQSLVATIKAQDFEGLKLSYTTEKPASDFLELTITMDGAMKSVKVVGPGDLKSDQEVSRFIGIWQAVKKLVPPPRSAL